MLPVISTLINLIQPFLTPICFIGAWSLIFLVISSLWSAASDGVTTAKQMHQIPCANCQFFTTDYRLKCTVHPSIANTEEAITCLDYSPQTNPMLY
ncbi:hypothetical protein [Brunnivagina elsteri]|uniref:Uncharacterized protein n=1 Tax=Brunnivagina elsteri CCALA 953 TaxID=987040 RepID=A0A2A2TFR1_9CYAN|nr:hypothetical protein [Calothrix elsteri]PAX52259.1 hypothetical protein CK510_20270 [Calothrix elsteri CCALA 953]